MAGSIIHSAKFYRVELLKPSERYQYTLDGGEEITVNYVVFHNVHQTIEYQTDKLPVALSICERFSLILENEEYLPSRERTNTEGAIEVLFDPEGIH